MVSLGGCQLVRLLHAFPFQPPARSRIDALVILWNVFSAIFLVFVVKELGKPRVRRISPTPPGGDLGQSTCPLTRILNGTGLTLQ